METSPTVVAAVVGVDGCGKSTAYRGSLEALASRLPVVGIGEAVLAGGPGDPVHPRGGVPSSRAARLFGRLARAGPRGFGYKNVKFAELLERARIREHLLATESPAVIVADGDPLVNAAAWAVARYFRGDLAGDDRRLDEVLHLLAGDLRIPWRELPRYLRRAPQLALVNRLGLARLRPPDLVVLLELDGETAMRRIRARGRPLQAHETAAFLDELGFAYERVCRVLESRRGITVIRVPAASTPPPEAARVIAEAVVARLPPPEEPAGPEWHRGDIAVVATTMSGSIKDQAKVGHIGPEFRARTARPVRVLLASTHAEARELTHRVVADGARIVVSAGGAGTFNAVLEGSHLDGAVPPDLRLAFLRKGSADLIGKMLHVPDQLGPAAEAIVGGIEAGDDVPADVLLVEAVEPDGRRQSRHVVGFAGLGLFGDVPRFTEARWIKYYKGILGTLFGDYGPFYTGFALATAYWLVRRLVGRVRPTTLVLDGEPLAPALWAAVFVANGDLGRAYPLGRGLSFSSGTFRVVALRYAGLRTGYRQFRATRSGRILRDPDRYGAVVREVRTLEARPAAPVPPFMVNVDGLRMVTAGEVRVTVSGRVRLVAGHPAGGTLPGLRPGTGSTGTRSR